MPENTNSILAEAEKIIYGDREKNYGRPDRNLLAIGRLWTVYLQGITERRKSLSVVAEDVAFMMVLMKVARLINQPDHRDSLVDICGYAALVERCQAIAKSSSHEPTNG